MTTDENEMPAPVLRCKLCKREAPLRNSHIVPEFLYRPSYNDKHQLMGITDANPRGWDLLQKGLREKLLCDSCEQLLNDLYEKPYKQQWVDVQPLPNPWVNHDIHHVHVDYRTFKLFHLSVLFRASVSSRNTFSAVSLGPHEDRIRQLLLSGNAGPAELYPLMGIPVIHHKTNVLVEMVSCTVEATVKGHCLYATMYGGVQWWIKVSSHRLHEFERVALKADGSIAFLPIPQTQVPIMREASRVLREALTRRCS